MAPPLAHLRSLVGSLLLVLPAAVGTSCTTTPETAESSSSIAWLPADLTRDPRLDEAAALLCARGGDAVVDDAIRVTAGIADGRVIGVLADSDDSAAAQVAALFAGVGLSHVGVHRGQSGGAPCVAAVGARRVIGVQTLPPSVSSTRTPSTLAVSLTSTRMGTVFVLGPDGFVDRLPLERGTQVQELRLPYRREGRHVVEVIVDGVDADGRPKGNPEVALLWPYVRGTLQLPPTPAVLFPDAGHDDVALTHRAEALVQRLRNEQLLDPLKITPVLGETALERARGLGGVLGHNIDGKNPKELLAAMYPADPRANFLRLAEVQARGSTLADAWAALTDSPAHRFELVSPGITHMGVAVVRGSDSLGRPTVTMVVLLARRPPNLDIPALKKKVVDDANAVRAQRGFSPLRVSDTLVSASDRLSRRMMEVRQVDATLLGGPIGSVALEADASMTKVIPFIARTDDPTSLAPFAALTEIDTTDVGVGLALHPEDGAYYVVFLAGIGAD